jgi:hypothetical protein
MATGLRFADPLSLAERVRRRECNYMWEIARQHPLFLWRHDSG